MNLWSQKLQGNLLLFSWRTSTCRCKPVGVKNVCGQSWHCNVGLKTFSKCVACKIHFNLVNQVILIFSRIFFSQNIYLVRFQMPFSCETLPTRGTLVWFLGRVRVNVEPQVGHRFSIFSAQSAPKSDRVLGMFSFYVTSNTPFSCEGTFAVDKRTWQTTTRRTLSLVVHRVNMIP